ncbi:hypothetical protein KXJ69_13425 [Aureisphaera sp. CAU 1614]|uniref:Uncharacterized protein n=1 Tax=Halomarinibacterium sedimenti TaxID=2857106 RepID=A0A9X1FR60_9FLAO|nr:hypothetical protein [Halomarinibacterium sedimenti]MBW2939111.1 hypothetical protein [Halomarinibacterium sedimenti]
MKRIITYIIFFAVGVSYAQIGIGTSSPQADLHVVGDMLIQESFIMSTLPTVLPLEEDFKLITRSNSSNPVGKVTELSVYDRAVAPINVVDYSFTNIQLDNLSDLDLQYDASKYIVAISNFRYTGDAITKTPVPATSTFSVGNFVVRTFISAGTWHLEIQNRILDADVLDTIEYAVTLIVYDKSFYRNLPLITTDLGGSNTGTASSTPILD